MSPVRVVLLGAPRFERDAQPVAIHTRKAIALLAYLVLTGRRHGRESLAALLWPDEDPPHARGALRNTLYELNKALGRAGLDLTRDDVAFVDSDSVTVDVVEFQRHISACRTHGHAPAAVCRACLHALALAAALYRDDFLAGFNAGASPEFEEWQLTQSEAIRRELGRVLERLSRGHRERGEFEAALAYARRWQSLDALDEAAQRRVMELYALGGQRAAALQSYQELVGRLERELGASPQAETSELYAAIQSNRFQPAPPHPVVGNLAAHMPPTPFIGREAELARLAQWLDDSDTRLLTLVGPGGIGKTRLALQAALTYAAHLADGAYFVPLAAIQPELLIWALAQALDLTLQSRYEPKTQLLNYLRDKHLLLVLDNFEHLRARAPLLTEILQQAPRIKLLVTSREWLNLAEESVLDLEGLPYPEANRSTRAKLEDYGAVQLFVQNARRVHWAFLLQPEARSVERICQLVEGMPLGIELASAWVRVIACHEIAQGIERDLGFLATTLGGLPERHRSLRVVFDYSYNRLSADVQAVFRKLSVFRGGFTRTAAERVAGASLDALVTLVDHTLLHRSASGRFVLHELLRQYGAEHLRAAAADASAALDAHGAYFAEYLQLQEPGLKGSTQREALDAIADDIDNVRAAWQHAFAQGRADALAQGFESFFLYLRIRSQFKEGVDAFARAAQALEGTPHGILCAELLTRQATFLELLGQFDEARATLQSALALMPPADQQTHHARAFALVELGAVAIRQGRLVEAKPLLQEALALYQADDDARGIAHALRWLGQVAAELEGDHRASQRLYRESLALYRRLGDQRSTASLLSSLSNSVGDLGDFAESERLLHESIGLYRELGDRYGVALVLNNLGVLARAQGRYEAAWQYFQDSLVIRREVGDRFAIALVLANLGKTATLLEKYDEAGRLLDESLALHRESGDRVHIANTLTKLGVLAMRTGDLRTAACHLQEGLRIARDNHAATMTMEILAEMAALRAARQDERAAELAMFVLQHPASDQVTKERAARLIAQLEAQASPASLSRVQARARTRELGEVTTELLRESA